MENVTCHLFFHRKNFRHLNQNVAESIGLKAFSRDTRDKCKILFVNG